MPINFPFNKTNSIFDFKIIDKEQYCKFIIALGNAFSFYQDFKKNNEDKQDKRIKYANIFYNLIQSRLSKFKSFCEKNGKDESIEYKKLIIKINEYFFFKDYNSLKKYDKLGTKELKENIEKLKKDKSEPSKINELELKLQLRNEKEKIIEIIIRILKNLENIRDFFSHVYHKGIKNTLTNEDKDFLKLLYRISCFANDNEKQNLILQNDETFSIYDVIFLLSLFSYKDTINDLLSSLKEFRYKDILKCKETVKCNDKTSGNKCKKFEKCQAEVNKRRNIFNFFSINPTFKKYVSENKSFYNINAILNFLYRQNYNFRTTNDDKNLINEIDKNFDFDRNNKEIITIFCDFLTYFFEKNNKNIRFQYKYDTKNINNFELNTVDKYKIFNNNVNMFVFEKMDRF